MLRVGCKGRVRIPAKAADVAAAHRSRMGVSWLSAEEAATHACVRAVRDAGGEPVPLLIDDESWTEINLTGRRRGGRRIPSGPRRTAPDHSRLIR
jgi:hypothetical protein